MSYISVLKNIPFFSCSEHIQNYLHRNQIKLCFLSLQVIICGYNYTIKVLNSNPVHNKKSICYELKESPFTSTHMSKKKGEM